MSGTDSGGGQQPAPSKAGPALFLAVVIGGLVVGAVVLAVHHLLWPVIVGFIVLALFARLLVAWCNLGTSSSPRYHERQTRRRLLEAQAAELERQEAAE